jgi:hypothetical protein
MSLTFNNLISSALTTSISPTTLSATANATTSAVTITPGNSNGGTLTYSWQQSGTTCTIVSTNVPSNTFTGSSVVGTTTVYSNVTNSVTGVTSSTPICTISWTAIPITAMTFLLNGVSFTTTQYRAPGGYTIAVGSVTPSGATYSPTSTTPPTTAGTYSLTSSGTGSYTGSYTSPSLVFVAGSISDVANTSTNHTLTASLSGGATITSVSWSRVSGTNCTFASGSSNPTSCTEVGTTISTTVVQCVISFSGGSVTVSTTVQWGVV